ncbi:MAG TPA: hypothetical protein VFT47_07315, partial [Vicinamibacterales bacterium]|nr:hypothetical protein [Vicinamibacterales bacterium]
IYSLILPLALLDLWVTLYQGVCFPAYRMARVRRGRFMTFDRHRLSYLNGIEKINCTFCSYANGVLAYTHEVAARTEQYWCPIKHRRRIAGAHRHYAGFFAFGDERGYHRGLNAQRRSLRSGRFTNHGKKSASRTWRPPQDRAPAPAPAGHAPCSLRRAETSERFQRLRRP